MERFSHPTRPPFSYPVDVDTSFFSLFRQMFIQGTVAEIKPTAFTVYCRIKAHADFNDGRSIPLEKDIVAQTGLSERQVQRSLKVLEKQGLLVWDKVRAAKCLSCEGEVSYSRSRYGG